MAIAPKDTYPGQVDDSDPAYPQGKARNVVAPGDGTGTPWEERLVNDVFGFQQALLSEAGLDPSGDPDQVGASQYVDAIRELDKEAYRLASRQVFTADATWNRPEGVRAVRVICVGGGGGGGAATGGEGSASEGGGGGGGGYVERWITSGLDESHGVVVGQGGDGGTDSVTDGADGTASAFGAHVLASPGFGGSSAGVGAAGDGGNGGVGVDGDINARGGDGGGGRVIADTGVQANSGGETVLGGRSYGPSSTGRSYGGGGSGGSVTDVLLVMSGGDGANGIVIVEEYV
ncbi:MAG: hypothetical protein ACOC9T_00490 [Myxococcota bacterium]